jgi:hypothetical protein
MSIMYVAFIILLLYPAVHVAFIFEGGQFGMLLVI